MTTPFKLAFTAAEPQLLRDALAGWGISKRTLTSIKYEGGRLLVNGADVTVRHFLEPGDAVTVIFPNEQRSAGLTAEEGDLAIIYEDRAVLIVEKPAGQSTIPSRDHPGGSLANLVAHHFEVHETPATLHIVTRLDRDTSGLVCIAKNRHIHHLLSLQQQTKKMRRQYEALVHGCPDSALRLITQPIGRKPDSIIEREVRSDGQFAETELEVEKSGEEFSHVKLRLNTGRTHQIRVHLSYAGHPLLGDDLYGGSLELIRRQALHCTKLQFLHPLSGQLLSFSSGLPDDMQRLLHV